MFTCRIEMRKFADIDGHSSNAPVNIFDMTKIWPKKLYPLRRMGRVTLNKNPDNWFADIEQAAFSPSNMVPGIAPSPDPMVSLFMSRGGS